MKAIYSVFFFLFWTIVQQTLLLQVGLVDSGKALDDDGAAAEMTWLQSRVLARRSLAVVLGTDDYPRDTA